MRYVLYGFSIILAVIVGSVFFNVLYRWIRYGYGFGFHKTPQEKEEEARRSEEYDRQELEKLQNPDFVGLEKLWGHPFPSSLKAFYEDKETIVQYDFEVGLKTLVGDDLIVVEFEPANAENVRYRRFGYFVFAVGDCKKGGPYDYAIDPRLEDPEVTVFEDGNHKWKHPLGVNLSDFLSSLRKKNSVATGLKE